MSKQKEKIQQQPAYILCYTLKRTRLTTVKTFSASKKPKITETTKEIFTDHYEVFSDWDDMALTPQEQAQNALNGVMAALDNEESNTEVYCWNICKVMQTSEHYETALEDAAEIAFFKSHPELNP